MEKFIFHASSVDTGFISPSFIAVATRNKAAAMWLQGEPLPAIQLQWALKIFFFFALCETAVYEAVLSVFAKVCSLLLGNNALIVGHRTFFQASPI